MSKGLLVYFGVLTWHWKLKLFNKGPFVLWSENFMAVRVELKISFSMELMTGATQFWGQI